MRILTWNINGIRTLPQYHPWNTMPTFADILDALEADILCFQEVKSSRSGLSKGNAVPPSYHAFFSFPVRKSGYSGVSTYVRAESATPIKAEEGICGTVQPKPSFTDEERISTPGAYPQHMFSGSDNDMDYKDLDSEGRTIVLDFGLFVLINVYCPNDGNGTEERNKYKADFHTALEARVKGLIEVEKREVIVVGDLNVCAAVIDHCEGHIMVSKGLAEGLQGEEGFWGKDSRRWMRGWMVSEDGTGGHMIDITRQLWPDRKDMYTCWNTKISARDSNYGTRIDYIMITRGLLPWVKAANIQPHIKGSDHCPVYLDLHDELVDAAGVTIKLQDAMGFKKDPPQDPPRIASKFWDEYSGKQRLLQQFFGKAVAGTPASAAPKSTMPAEPDDNHDVRHPSIPNLPAIDATELIEPPPPPPPEPLPSDETCEPHASPPLSTPSSSIVTSRSQNLSQSPSSTSVKRKLTTDTLARNSSSKKKLKQTNEKNVENRPGQATLASFFAKPKITSISSPTATSSKGTPMLQGPENIELPSGVDLSDVDIDADHQLALLLSAEEAEPSQRTNREPTMAKQAWSSLMAPIQPPKCSVHGEIAKELTVTKPGPNKGKKFFICSRPVGPGYDKGRMERLREHVDAKWRCDYFKWSSEARRQMRVGEGQ